MLDNLISMVPGLPPLPGGKPDRKCPPPPPSACDDDWGAKPRGHKCHPHHKHCGCDG